MDIDVNEGPPGAGLPVEDQVMQDAPAEAKQRCRMCQQDRQKCIRVNDEPNCSRCTRMGYSCVFGHDAVQTPQPKRRTLNYKKCTFCRKDKQKCMPSDRHWPKQKCERCTRKGLPCSAPEGPKAKEVAVSEVVEIQTTPTMSTSLPRAIKDSLQVVPNASERHPKQQPLERNSRCVDSIPWPRNMYFSGRQELLETLKKQLQPPCGAHLQSQPRVALFGMGGVGKTQIALEYAYQARETADCVFWISGTTDDSIRHGYSTISNSLNLGFDSKPARNLLQEVKYYIEQDSRKWLLVLDDVDDFALLNPPAPHHQDGVLEHANIKTQSNRRSGLTLQIPRSSNVALLLTTRNKHIALRMTEGSSIIELQSMRADESRRLFQLLLKNESDSEAMITELLSCLGHLPLAIVQAATFIQENSMSVSRYLHLLKDQYGTELLSTEFKAVEKGQGISTSVISVISTSFQQMSQQDPLAIEVLGLMSFLHPDSISRKIILQCAEESLASSDESIDILRLETVLGLLKAYSLIRETTDENLAAHTVVQIAIQKWIQPVGEHERLVGSVLLAILKAWPGSNYEKWKTCELYIIHIDHLSNLKIFGSMSNTTALLRASVLHLAAELSTAQGLWAKARLYEIDAVNRRREILGEEHSDTIASLAQLAIISMKQGNLLEAEKLMKQVLRVRTELSGEEHPDTLACKSDLSRILWSAGKLEDAKKLCEAVLVISDKKFSRGHPSTLRLMGTIASIYRSQGRLALAQEIETTVLETRMALFGKEHPDTLSSMADLASTLWEQGQWQMAKELALVASELRLRVLGQDHPDTLSSMSDLAAVFWQEGKWPEAQTLESRVLRSRQQVLGEGHPSTLVSMYNLAFTWNSMGRGPEAMALLADCVDKGVGLYGQSHSFVKSSQSVLNEWRKAPLEH